MNTIMFRLFYVYQSCNIDYSKIMGEKNLNNYFMLNEMIGKTITGEFKHSFIHQN